MNPLRLLLRAALNIPAVRAELKRALLPTEQERQQVWQKALEEFAETERRRQWWK